MIGVSSRKIGVQLNTLVIFRVSVLQINSKIAFKESPTTKCGMILREFVKAGVACFRWRPSYYWLYLIGFSYPCWTTFILTLSLRCSSCMSNIGIDTGSGDAQLRTIFPICRGFQAMQPLEPKHDKVMAVSFDEPRSSETNRAASPKWIIYSVFVCNVMCLLLSNIWMLLRL